MYYDLIKCGGKNSVINFPHPDDKDRWQKQRKLQGKGWKYRSLKDNPIYFNNNSMGYRTYEFDFDNDSEYMLALGCSNTYGLYLHEEERYSNLIENETNIKTYNLGISGGSACLVMMNLSKFLYSAPKKPKAIIIQWPEYMRLNFPVTDPYEGIYNVRASSSYGSKNTAFEELVRAGNTLETHSSWAKDTTYNILNSLNIKTIDFAKDKDAAEFYNVPFIEKVDRAYDHKHIGTQTNKDISKFVLERL